MERFDIFDHDGNKKSYNPLFLMEILIKGILTPTSAYIPAERSLLPIGVHFFLSHDIILFS